MEYKVGDWVELVDYRGDGWVSSGNMDKYIGRTVKLTRVDEITIDFEGNEGWELIIHSVAVGNGTAIQYYVFKRELVEKPKKH